MTLRATSSALTNLAECTVLPEESVALGGVNVTSRTARKDEAACVQASLAMPTTGVAVVDFEF